MLDQNDPLKKLFEATDRRIISAFEEINRNELENKLQETKEMLAMSESLRKTAEEKAERLEEELAAAKRQLLNGSNADGDYARLWEKNDELIAKNAELLRKLKDSSDAIIEANRRVAELEKQQMFNESRS